MAKKLYIADVVSASPAKATTRPQRLLFVMPEYNRSAPGVLKHAPDHASRPYAPSVGAGKPGFTVAAFHLKRPTLERCARCPATLYSFAGVTGSDFVSRLTVHPGRGAHGFCK